MLESVVAAFSESHRQRQRERDMSLVLFPCFFVNPSLPALEDLIALTPRRSSSKKIGSRLTRDILPHT
jgi:hypothetical protein